MQSGDVGDRAEESVGVEGLVGGEGVQGPHNKRRPRRLLGYRFMCCLRSNRDLDELELTRESSANRSKSLSNTALMVKKGKGENALEDGESPELDVSEEKQMINQALGLEGSELVSTGKFSDELMKEKPMKSPLNSELSEENKDENELNAHGIAASNLTDEHAEDPAGLPLESSGALMAQSSQSQNGEKLTVVAEGEANIISAGEVVETSVDLSSPEPLASPEEVESLQEKGKGHLEGKASGAQTSSEATFAGTGGPASKENLDMKNCVLLPDEEEVIDAVDFEDARTMQGTGAAEPASEANRESLVLSSRLIPKFREPETGRNELNLSDFAEGSDDEELTDFVLPASMTIDGNGESSGTFTQDNSFSPQRTTNLALTRFTEEDKEDLNDVLEGIEDSSVAFRQDHLMSELRPQLRHDPVRNRWIGNEAQFRAFCEWSDEELADSQVNWEEEGFPNAFEINEETYKLWRRSAQEYNDMYSWITGYKEPSTLGTTPMASRESIRDVISRLDLDSHERR